MWQGAYPNVKKFSGDNMSVKDIGYSSTSVFSCPIFLNLKNAQGDTFQAYENYDFFEVRI